MKPDHPNGNGSDQEEGNILHDVSRGGDTSGGSSKKDQSGGDDKQNSSINGGRGNYISTKM